MVSVWYIFDKNTRMTPEVLLFLTTLLIQLLCTKHALFIHFMTRRKQQATGKCLHSAQITLQNRYWLHSNVSNLSKFNIYTSYKQGWKLTSARQPMADNFQSGLMIFLKYDVESARVADNFLSRYESQFSHQPGWLTIFFNKMLANTRLEKEQKKAEYSTKFFMQTGHWAGTSLPLARF